MTISVVIPAYNEERHIGRCLAALRQQTLQPLEVIVVDNNSSDATAAIAREYGARLVTEKEQGIWAAAHTGYDSAKGTVIARIDAETIVPEDWLKRIEYAFMQHPDVVAVTGPGGFYDGPYLLTQTARVWYMWAYFILIGSALAKWPLYGSNCAFFAAEWRAAADTIHNQNDIHDDIDLSFHLEGKTLLMPTLLVTVSARALERKQLARRFAKGYRALTIHWPEHSPWRRWKNRLVDRLLMEK